MNIYPNPAEDLLTINLDNEITGRLNVYDLTGQIVLTQDIQSALKLEIDIKKIPSGLYIIKLICSKGNYTSKFVKQ